MTVRGILLKQILLLAVVSLVVFVDGVGVVGWAVSPRACVCVQSGLSV